MNILRLSAATIALIGYGASVLADEPTDSAQTAADGVSETSEMRWSEFDPARSTLLKQANAVYAALRAREAAEQGIELDTVFVSAADAAQSPSNPGNCRHLAEAGSLIMRERCFYETRGEAALNEFQYRMETQFIRDQQDRAFLEAAEYELAYRRSLQEQQ
jgi:hypothetical protein